MKKRIQVTQKDILKALAIRKGHGDQLFRKRHGDQLLGKSCPIALACRRHFRTSAVFVGMVAEINHCLYDLPKKATDFIERFDNGQRVCPFTFSLERNK